jgi:hypothetical protein
LIKTKGKTASKSLGGNGTAWPGYPDLWACSVYCRKQGSHGMVFTMNAFILIVDKIKYLCYPFKKSILRFSGGVCHWQAPFVLFDLIFKKFEG